MNIYMCMCLCVYKTIKQFISSLEIFCLRKQEKNTKEEKYGKTH